MRRFAVTFLASVLTACGNSPDFCKRFQPVLVMQENQIQACPIPDGGAMASDALAVVGGEFPFSIEACEAQLPDCNANDLTELNHELACIQQLPAFDCSALGEEDDAGLAAFMGSVAVCEPTDISVACKGGLDSGMGGCGMESHIANTSQNQPLPLGFQTPITDCLGVGLTDVHYLSLTPPTVEDGGPKGGGYYEIVFSGISSNVQGQLNVTLADHGGNPLHLANSIISTPSTIFLSTTATATFLVEVHGDSQIPLGYTISASYILINDPYKADSQMTIAHTIPVATPTSGSYLWAGQNSADALITSFGGDFDDWFEVDITTGGTYTITLTGFPFDFAPAVDFVDAMDNVILPITVDGVPGVSKSNTTGAAINYDVIAPTPELYWLHVYPNQVDNTKYAAYSMNPLLMSAVLPSNFTEPYSLTIAPTPGN